VRYGEGSKQADRWVRQIGKDLRAGKVLEVIARLERLSPPTLQAQESLQTLIGYYREHAARLRYDEYLRLGYGIGNGALKRIRGRKCSQTGDPRAPASSRDALERGRGAATAGAPSAPVKRRLDDTGPAAHGVAGRISLQRFGVWAGWLEQVDLRNSIE